MTKEEALAAVISAAGHWADELAEYIIPASEMFGDMDSAESQEDEADQIHEAIKVLRGES